jgi:tetratricopeptide (TPR) repeat protein
LTFGALAFAFLIPISAVQRGIETDQARVGFLRWVDNQEAFQKQVVQRIVKDSDDRTPEEIDLLERVEELGSSLDPNFGDLQVDPKWAVIRRPEFSPLLEDFVRLARQSKVTLVEGEVEWANPDVSANVGALVFGFRKLVADMLWLKFDEYWHLGLVQRMLPIMETVVTLDPHFVEAYAIGAWHLAYNVTVMFHSVEEKQKYIDLAVVFLEKGIKNNPRSSKLYSELGFTIYFFKLHDYEKAAYYLGEATNYEHDPWVERAYALSLERLREEEKALAVLEDYSLRHPDYIMQKFSIARLQQKLQARQLEEEGKLREAFEIWNFIKEDDPADVVAPAEVVRLRALLGRDTAPHSDHGVSASE